MIIIDWIRTYEFLGYAPNDALEQEIYNKAIYTSSAVFNAYYATSSATK